MKILTTLLLAAPLFACAMASEMVLPDGSPGFLVSCNGAALTIGDCYKKAGNLCPQGYTILGQDEEKNQTTIGSIQPGLGVITSSPSITREIYVHCK